MNDNSKSQLLISVEEVFERYFQYGNYVGDLPNYLIEKVISNLSQTEKLENIVKPYYRTSVLRKILMEVTVRAGFSFEKKNYAIDFIRFCFDLSDHFVEDEESRMGTPIRFISTNAIEVFLQEFSSEYRVNVIWSAVNRSKAVSGIVMMVALWKSEKEKDKLKESFIADADLKNLTLEAKKRGLKWIKQNNSLDHPQFNVLINIIRGICEYGEFNSALMVLLNRSHTNYKRFIGKFLFRGEQGKEEFNFKFADSIIDLKELHKMSYDFNLAFSDTDGKENVKAWELFSSGLDNFLRLKIVED